MELTILPSSLKDIWEIDRIERAAFITPWSLELIRAAVVSKQYEVRVLSSEDVQVIGFYITHGKNGKINLDNLVVEESIRGKGFGSKLILDWIERGTCHGASTLTLQVNAANWRAQKLYRVFDFTITRLMPGYYPNGDDAYEMARTLRSKGVIRRSV